MRKLASFSTCWNTASIGTSAIGNCLWRQAEAILACSPLIPFVVGETIWRNLEIIVNIGCMLKTTALIDNTRSAFRDRQV